MSEYPYQKDLITKEKNQLDFFMYVNVVSLKNTNCHFLFLFSLIMHLLSSEPLFASHEGKTSFTLILQFVMQNTLGAIWGSMLSIHRSNHPSIHPSVVFLNPQYVCAFIIVHYSATGWQMTILKILNSVNVKI